MLLSAHAQLHVSDTGRPEEEHKEGLTKMAGRRLRTRYACLSSPLLPYKCQQQCAHVPATSDFTQNNLHDASQPQHDAAMLHNILSPCCAALNHTCLIRRPGRRPLTRPAPRRRFGAMPRHGWTLWPRAPALLPFHAPPAWACGRTAPCCWSRALWSPAPGPPR